MSVGLNAWIARGVICRREHSLGRKCVDGGHPYELRDRSYRQMNVVTDARRAASDRSHANKGGDRQAVMNSGRNAMHYVG